MNGSKGLLTNLTISGRLFARLYNNPESLFLDNNLFDERHKNPETQSLGVLEHAANLLTRF